MSPNIYYAAAIQEADGNSKQRAKRTIACLQNHGKVLTEHIGFDDVASWEAEQAAAGANVFERDISWLNNCDLMVADVGRASTGVGMEIMYATGVLNIPVLAVYEDGLPASGMVTKFEHPSLQRMSYGDQDDLEAKLGNFMAEFQVPWKVYPHYVVCDAIDGAGKGVMLDTFKTWATEKGLGVVDTIAAIEVIERTPNWRDAGDLLSDGKGILALAQPTYAGMGKIIRGTIIKKGSPHGARSAADAYAIDREILFHQLVSPALKNGVVTVSDRGVITSEVYQPVQANLDGGTSPAFFLGRVRGLAGNQFERNHVPGLMIVPQVDVDLAQSRLQGRDEKQDDTDFERRPFQEAIASVYADDVVTGDYERKGTKVVKLEVGRGDDIPTVKGRVRAIWDAYRKEAGL